MADSQPLQVLLVEDDPGDVLITQEALSAGHVRSTVHVVGDGEKALRFLRRQQEFEQVPRPDLILLDLNLPKVNGHEVLQDVKADADLRRIPIVVLSTSRAPEDVLRSYDLHANAYVSKPVDFDSFVDAVTQIDDFFARIVDLPRA